MKVPGMLVMTQFITYVGGIALSMPIHAQSSRWEVPASAQNIKSPYNLKDPKLIALGKKLYSKHCNICHGAKGKGDGVAGLALNPKPANFTTDAFQSQASGVIFWKITHGNPPMASYESILSEKERWALVAYLRTLK